MSCKIYCIEDINGLKYVGKTNDKNKSLCKRMWRHRNGNNCSSKKLDLNNCEVKILEECDKINSKERERYWINNIDCVNECKLNGTCPIKKKQTRRRLYLYQTSWGGDLYRYDNNLLLISPDIFSYNIS